MAAGDEPRYLTFETQNFSPDQPGPPRTSFLRLGAIADATLVGDIESMRARTPTAGAVTAASGAGEDLAARVASFEDDERNRCDPPSLDDNVAAKQAADAVADVAAQKKALDDLTARLGQTDDILYRVFDDARGWLASLSEEAAAAKTNRAALQARYDAMLARFEAAAAKNAAPGGRAFAPGYQTLRARREESKLLHTKGGVRDHTDGNRIVTTRGDKVEIVRGNYKLVVLGRYRDPENAESLGILPGQELSGGHYLEPSLIVAQETEIAWKRRQNGTWHTLETTTKDDTATVTTGDHESEAYGHYRRSTVGSETPTTAWHAPEDCPGPTCKHPNPKVSTQLWATDMVSTTGSPRWHVPSMHDETHAKTFVSELHAGAHHDETTATTMSASTTVDGEMETSVTVGTMETLKTAATINESTMVPVMASITIGDSQTKMTGIRTNVTLGTSTDLHVGAELNVTSPGSASVHVGAALDVFLGAKLDLVVGGTLSLTVGETSSLSTAANIHLTLIEHTKVAPIIAVAGGIITVG